MKGSQELIDALNNSVNVPVQVILGEVTSVDTGNQTAVIKLDVSGNVTYTIRLKSIVDGNATGFVVFPAVGAKVLAGKIYNRDDYFMITCSQAQEVWLRGKENGGLINISSLVDRINDLENDVNALQSSLRKWTPVSGDGGAALKTYLTTNYPTQHISETTDKSDYEDTEVLH